MKLFVDKIPERGEDCLFNKVSERHSDYHVCMLTGRTCWGKPVCHHLKEREKKETEIKPCLCGSKDVEMSHIGNPLAGLYYVRCKACAHTSEYSISEESAIINWNAEYEAAKEVVKIHVIHSEDIYTPYHYQVAAKTTADPKLSTEKALVEGLVGINSEAGEALDIWKKYEFHKHDLDAKAIALELGDVLWYLTEAAVALGYSLEDIMKMNIEKLSKRYPDGFDPERSKNREV